MSDFINSVESKTRAVSGQEDIILAGNGNAPSISDNVTYLNQGGTQIELAVSFFSNSIFVARANASVA